MIVAYWAEEDLIRIRTHVDVIHDVHGRGSWLVVLDGNFCTIRKHEHEWWVFNDLDKPIHSLGTADPEIAIAKLNLLYRTE